MSSFPYRVIDLTHALSPDIPTWDGSCGFEHHLNHDYDPKAEYQFRTHKIRMSEGIGTHMDAPAHCCARAKTIDELDLAELVSPCVVIDIRKVSHERYSLSVQDVLDFEKVHGAIVEGSFVMVRTGWSRFWGEAEKYRNNHLFPDISEEAAALLLERGVRGLGIDTLSPDRGDQGFPVHKLMLSAEKYLVENAAHLDQMPAQGGFVLVMPLKIKGGTEAPVRLVGLINK